MATDGRKTDTKKVLARVATMRSRSQIEALEDFINRYTDDDLLQVNVRLSHLEASWTSFEAANLKLETLEEEEAALVILFKERNMLFERYCKAKGFLTSKVPQESTTSVTVNAADVSVSSLSKLRLPKLDLPTFDGNTTEWLSFKDRFMSMIDASPDLTPVMKLQYLLSVLKGDVAKRFQQVTLIADNYDTTWQALLDRYDNVRALKREYFRALTSIPPMKGESIEELRRVTDEFHRLTQGLSALDEPIALWNTPLCNLLFYKLDAKTLLAWEEFSCNEPEDSYKKLQEFLQKRLRILVATNHSTHDVQRPSTSKVAGTKPITRLANASVVPSSSTKCYACDDSHYLHQCIKFKEMSLSQKDSLIASHKLCRNCFRTGHVAKGCQSKFRCHKCQQRHHTLLHIHQAMPEVSTPDNLIVATTACNTNLTVLLQTAMVCVIDDDGNVFKARALLDSGSMSNFMSTALAKRLSNKIQNENVSIIGIGKSESLIRHSVNATISSHAENFRTRLNFLVLDSPTSCLPTIDVDIRDWKIEELVLADPMFNTPGPIDIVIGGDTFWKQNVTRLLNQYGFSLRKWASNDSRVLENIKDEDLASPKGLEFLQDNPITTLGLVWKPQNDTFCYNIKNNPVPIANTKRQLLSSVAQIFDPLGLIGPVVCKAKLMMQQAWNIIDADTEDHRSTTFCSCFGNILERFYHCIALAEFITISLEDVRGQSHISNPPHY
ncbi:uncharacterized protein LOC125774298 [Anopheles funestus]|uniref:uncharacterized protein LOC125774298 n=2 Tax=Anopheles funestus TaxID=62324 RepID=UPI0020C5B612|nr:uncharacterized protein LOC125774298 [Anopheles funestus]